MNPSPDTRHLADKSPHAPCRRTFQTTQSPKPPAHPPKDRISFLTKGPATSSRELDMSSNVFVRVLKKGRWLSIMGEHHPHFFPLFPLLSLHREESPLSSKLNRHNPIRSLSDHHQPKSTPPCAPFSGWYGSLITITHQPCHQRIRYLSDYPEN